MTALANARVGTLASVLKNVSWLLVGKASGAILSLVYLGLATRTLKPEGFGQFALVLGVGQAVVGLVSFQTWQIVVRYGTAHRAASRAEALGRLTAFCLALDCGGALVGCGLATLVVLALHTLLGVPSDLRWPALGLCFAMLLSIRSTAVGLLRLHDRFGVGALADSSTSLMRLAGALGAVWVGSSVEGFLLAWAVAEVVTALSYWLLVLRVAPVHVRWPSRDEIARTLRENEGLGHFALITNFGSTLTTASKQFPILIIGGMLGPVAAGAYRLAYQAAQALARGSDMFARAAFAELSRVHAAGKATETRRLFRQTTRLAVIAAAIISAVLGVAGRPLLHALAGPGYDAAYPLLMLLGLAACVDVAAVGFEPFLMATGAAARAFRIRLGVSIGLVTGLIMATWLLGIYGAGIVMLGASLLGLVLFSRAIRDKD